jgi:dynein heavy chain
MRELDKDMERALKSSVKNSLLDLQKHIKGDQQEIMPIFKIFTVISDKNVKEQDQDWLVINEPSHATLRDSVIKFIKFIIETTSVVPRIEKVFRTNHEVLVNEYWKRELELMRNSGGGAVRGADANYQNLTEEEKEDRYRKDKQLPEPDKKRRFESQYVEYVSQSREINQLSTHITEIVENIKNNMESECRSWQNAPEVKQIMSMGTTRGKTRFLKQSNSNNSDKVDKNPQLVYKSVIESVGEHIDDVRNKQATRNEQFIILDSSKLKTRLIDGGQEYIHYILNNLVSDSKAELHKLLTHMVETVDELKQHSSKLEQLKLNRERLAQVRAEQGDLEAQLEPIKRKFGFIMDDGNNSNGTIELTDEDKAKLLGLDDAWSKYIKGLAEAQTIINKNYAELKAEMENTIDDFRKDVQENRQNFKSNAYTAVDKNDEFNNSKALEKVEEFKLSCADLRSKEDDMKFGLDIFEQEPADYTDLSLVEKENQLLADIWHVKEDWDNQWNEWKHITFYQLDVAMMEEVGYDYKRKLQSMNKEVKQWQVFDYLKSKVQLFIDMMGLLPDLLHESIRERHWNDIRFEVKEEFNQHSDEFNLEKVFELELNKHASMIGELADHARKQLKIEQSLNEIKFLWEESPDTNLDIKQERSRADNEDFFKVVSTENIFAVIEEHTQALSQHKSSPYYKQFDEKIDLWDTNIANITETLEMLIQVQSKWMYLESIFKGQPDLAK